VTVDGASADEELQCPVDLGFGPVASEEVPDLRAGQAAGVFADGPVDLVGDGVAEGLAEDERGRARRVVPQGQGGSQVGGTPSMGTKTGWHTFGADWETGSITYYYDGKAVGKATSGVVNNPMYLILNYGVSSSISGPIQVPSSLLVDYVRVWQH